MTWHWSAAMGFALASCGGAGRAVPTEVEIDWPDAATPKAAKTPEPMDAGVEPTEASQPQVNDAGLLPSE